ncbi:uncharacterized protein LOC109838112 [Asparagus officinalis]|uniref:uncharacterized protein LOC109838112 n=1 Tax=Asparagus officinalis TaxID=4686 RepID=UPI00098E0B14|nr:uncharacterized protein LOC109838112 [Asparagus officinalis]
MVRKILSQRVVCREMIRMNPPAFHQLCGILERDGGLKRTQRVTIEEQVAKFLYMLGHNVTTREVSKIFGRSGESVSRHFYNVLRAMIELEEIFLVQPNGAQIPPEILNNPKFDPYFKDCVGAIDGTHIRLKVSPTDAPKYRGRKDHPTQNVLAACTFDLKFTYVLLGGTDPKDDFLEGEEDDNENSSVEDDVNEDEDEQRGKCLRDSIAASMWQYFNA